MLTNYEMMNIEGGSVNWSIIGVVGASIAFVAGIIDGFFRPLRCR